MKPALYIPLVFILCGSLVYGFLNYNRIGSVTNTAFQLVRVSSSDREPSFDVGLNESVPLAYGIYEVSIPQLDKSFTIFKNDPGSFEIHYINETLVFKTEGNVQFNGP